MYLVRGNRYQIFELEPLKHLLPPHCKVLQELFGVSAADVINGLEKLQYSLSQGYADTMISFGKEYDIFLEALESGTAPEKAIENAKDRTLRIAGKLFGSDLIDVMAVTGWDSLFIDALSLEIGEYHTFWSESEFSGWPIVELPVIRKPFIKINGKAYYPFWKRNFILLLWNIRLNMSKSCSLILITVKYNLAMNTTIFWGLNVKFKFGREVFLCIL